MNLFLFLYVLSFHATHATHASVSFVVSNDELQVFDVWDFDARIILSRKRQLQLHKKEKKKGGCN